MKPPTAKKIATELAALKKMAPRIRQVDFFGNNNCAFIDAQIKVLEDDLSEDDIYGKESEGDWDGDVVSHAISARQWIDGEETEPPSSGWAPLQGK